MNVKLENWSFVDVDWRGFHRFPYLSEFRPIQEGLTLHGQAYGHPVVLEGNRAHTSPVVKIDIGARTCTTRSGTVYELGTPYPDYVDALNHMTYRELLNENH